MVEYIAYDIAIYCSAGLKVRWQDIFSYHIEMTRSDRQLNTPVSERDIPIQQCQRSILLLGIGPEFNPINNLPIANITPIEISDPYANL